LTRVVTLEAKPKRRPASENLGGKGVGCKRPDQPGDADGPGLVTRTEVRQQERLGHANIATTMDLYTHVMPGMQDEAASRVDAALRAAISKRVVS